MGNLRIWWLIGQSSFSPLNGRKRRVYRVYPIFKQSHIPIFEKPLEFSITPTSLAKASTGLEACQAQDLITEPWRLVSFFSCQYSKPQRIAMVIHGPCGDSMGYHFRDTRIIAGQPPMEMGNPGHTATMFFCRLRGKMEPAPTLRPLGFHETFKDSRFFLIVHPCSVAWDSWLYGRLQREVQVFLHLAGARRRNGSDGQKPIKNRWCTKSTLW